MRSISILLAGIALSVLAVGITAAQNGVTIKPVLQTTTNTMGRPIVFPRVRNQFTVLTIDIAPGNQLGRHMHPVPLVVYVLAGTLTVEEDGYPARTYARGQAFAEAVNVWHNAINRGTAPVRVLVVVAGEEGKPVLVKP
ncbi:MAG TPA: cupin domain-containing protein [bacterium]